jgi:hypothetical protein
VPPSNWFAEGDEFAAAWETGVPFDETGNLGFELQAEKASKIRAAPTTTLVVAWNRKYFEPKRMIAPPYFFVMVPS